jgi:hypothetical protein
LFYHLNDPTGASLVLADETGAEAGRMVYDGYGGVLSNTLPLTLSGTLADVPDAATGLVHQGGGRYYDPTLGRPLQPNPAGGPTAVPQALNRYAATPVGQPGVYAAADSNYRNSTFASLAVGFAKTLAFETAARSTVGIFGNTLTSAAYHYSKSIVQLRGSYSFVERSRGLIEAAGGDLLRTRLRIRSGQEGVAAIRQATLEFGFDSPSLAADVAVQLNRQGGWAQLGHGINVWSEVDHVVDSTRVPRYVFLSKWYVAGGADFLLAGVFQYAEDLQNPYFHPEQRFARVGIAGLGGFAAGLGGTVIGTSLGCGPYAPICIAGSSVVLGAAWVFGVQPMVFDAVPFLQPPPRDLMPLN